MKRTSIVALTALAALYELLRWSFNPVYRRDFINLWLAPRAAATGVDPYSLDGFLAFAQGLFPAIYPEQVNFTYPPHALMLFGPFAALPPVAAYAAWSIVSILFFWWAARPFFPKDFPVAAALLSPAALINLRYGQTGLVASALFLLAFRPSGLAAALLTFKPQMGLLVIPALLREKRSLAVAVGVTLILVATSALLIPNAWESFVRHAADFQGGKLASGAELPWMYKAVTPMIFYGLWGWLLFVAGAAWILARNYGVFTAATATFLISPYGFHYDMAAACLGFLLLLWTSWDAMPAWQRAVVALAILSPVLVDLGSWLAPPILLLALAVQVERDDRAALGNRGAGGHSAAS